MTQWLTAAPAIACAVLVLLVPGLVVGGAFRLRGLWLWAAAAPLSVSTVAVASVALSLLGLPWGWWSVGAVTAALAAIVWLLVRVWWKQQPAEKPGPAERRPYLRVAAAGALVVGGVLVSLRMMQAIGGPENISQTFDNIFHLNAVRFILDTQDASPLRIGLMNSPQGNLGFYPSGWHAVVSLVAELSRASIALATNATVIVVGGIVWVAGSVLFVRTVVGARTVVTVATAVLASASVAFPFLLMSYGVLYPLYLGLALVPVGLAAVVTLTGLGRSRLHLNTPTAWLLLAAVLPGIALAHPGALMGMLAMTVPIVAVWAWCRVRSGTARWRTLLIFVVFLTAGVVALVKVRPPREQSNWPPTLEPLEAVGRFLTLALTHPPIPWALAALTLIGVVVALLRRHRQDFILLGMYGMAATLFTVVAGVEEWRIRFWTTGVWYQNIPRIEAITVLATLPLAVVGLVWLVDVVPRKLFGRNPSRGEPEQVSPPAARVAAGVVMLVLLVAALLNPQMAKFLKKTSDTYEYTRTAALVSADERALLLRLNEEVPEDATIVTNGWTGAGLAYAFAGRWVTMPHVMIDFTEETLLLNDYLNAATPGSEVCAAAVKQSAEYVLDFGSREVHGGAHVFPGLTGLDASPAVELVDQEGEAKLYRIIGCEGA